MSTHISTLALRNTLPKGCNGEGAAHEFARHLLPVVREALLHPTPAPAPTVDDKRRASYAEHNASAGYRAALHVVDEEPREMPTACPRCHEDAGYHKNRCAHCNMKRGRRLRRVRFYGTTEAA